MAIGPLCYYTQAHDTYGHGFHVIVHTGHHVSAHVQVAVVTAGKPLKHDHCRNCTLRDDKGGLCGELGVADEGTTLVNEAGINCSLQNKYILVTAGVHMRRDDAAGVEVVDGMAEAGRQRRDDGVGGEADRLYCSASKGQLNFKAEGKVVRGEHGANGLLALKLDLIKYFIWACIAAAQAVPYGQCTGQLVLQDRPHTNDREMHNVTIQCLHLQDPRRDKLPIGVKMLSSAMNAAIQACNHTDGLTWSLRGDCCYDERCHECSTPNHGLEYRGHLQRHYALSAW